MKIGFVITNYNNSDLTKGAIESLNKNKDADFEIVVVDNSSDDNNLQKLKIIEMTIKNVSVIYSPKNVGYFKGLNLGIRQLRSKYPVLNWIIVGNNDVLFPNSFYNAILSKLSLSEKYPVISPNIITQDGFHQNPHVVNKISKLREFIYDIYHTNYFIAKWIIFLSKITNKFTDRNDEDHHETAQEIYQGYGAMYILTPKFFENFDELWSPSFLLYEEYFLSKQLSDKGYKVYYEPSIKMTHLMHASTNKLPKKLKWKFSKDSHKIYRNYIKVFSK